MGSGLSLALCYLPRAAGDIDHQAESLLARIARFQPELAADLLLPAVDSGSVPDAVAVRLLKELYNRAGTAKAEYPSVPAERVDKDHADQMAWLLSTVGVDANSIRLRGTCQDF